MTITIQLELTDEEANAVQSAAARCPVQTSESAFLAGILQDEIARLVASAYTRELLRIGEAAKPMPFDARKELISQIEAAPTLNGNGTAGVTPA